MSSSDPSPPSDPSPSPSSSPAPPPAPTPPQPQEEPTRPPLRPTVQIPPTNALPNSLGQGRRGAVDATAGTGAQASNQQPPLQTGQGAGPASYAAAAAAGAGNGAAAGAPPAGPAPVAPPPAPARPKQLVYTFPSPPPDTADLVSELEEFYSYVEVPQVVEHMQSWADWWDGEQEFTKSPSSVQHSTIRTLLATLNHPLTSPSERHQTARHLLHLAHGCFAPGVSTSPEHHLHLILSMCRVLRAAGALQHVWAALQRTGREWDDASVLPPAAAAAAAGHPQHDEDEDDPRYGGHGHGHEMSEEDERKERERQDHLDEVNAELALLLAVLYFMVECFRGEEQWGEELMALDPPMPIYLYNQVANLREKNAKGYPVKKLLLLLWKSMLCTLGGMKDVERVKVLVREIEGLPKDDPESRPHYRPWTKVTPPDILTFRNETLSKYPTYVPPPPSALLPLPPALAALGNNPTTLDRLSAAAAPVPVRPTFSYHINANHDPLLPANQPPLPVPLAHPGAGAAHWQPPTPAPSPPPTPGGPNSLNGPNGAGGGLGGPGGAGPPLPPGKPKKQQFQTDQSRPFPLPFAPANFKRGRLPVPRAVEEAGELYRGNLRVSTELWQSWKVREEFGGEEMGLVKAEAVESGRGREVEAAAVERERGRRRETDASLASAAGMGGMAGRAEEGRRARALGRRLEELILADKGRRASGTSTAGDESDAGSATGSTGKRRSLLAAVAGESAIADDDSASASGSAGDEDGEGEEDDGDPMDPMTVLRRLGRHVRRETEAEEEGSKKREELEGRRGDVKRLERVEALYRHTLPHLQSAVIVLLKLLLATVTANQNQNLTNAALNGEGGANDPLPDSNLSLEDCDILRHREITSKAVSAILILTLKWFKASHIMKFHYFSQLLVDSNCLLLILKMFGLQEVSTLVRVKHDRPDHNFFQFCHEHINPAGSPRPEDALLSRPPRPRSPSTASSAHGSSPKSTGAVVSGQTSPSATGSGGADDVELVSDYSWRNFFSTINFVHVLQKLTKRKTHRVLLMVQYKSSAILKRILKVSHPTLQLYVLKVIKSQVPYCGRKWRQSNMKVITAIYLHCRPDLRDEWLAGVDVDADVEESLPHEQALRSLVRFFNTKHYSKHAPGLHRRSSSVGRDGTHSPDFNPGPVASVPLPPLSPHASGPLGDGTSLDDVFPPPRAVSAIDCDSTIPMQLAYGALDPSDDLGAYAVDDLLAGSGGALDDPSAAAGGGVVDHDELLDWLNDPLGASDAAWERLGLEGYEGEWDDVSDSESVGGWGFMRFGDDSGSAIGDDADEGMDERRSRNEWEHISPETITALEEERRAAVVPNSPRPRRRSSAGPVSPALRPVIFDRDDDAPGSGARGDDDDAIGQQEEGPVQTSPHSGPAVDEVELVFGQ
ncbi:hypothetical protein JCM10207_005258 [Rhodosporidiobolus poonsookiae]